MQFSGRKAGEEGERPHDLRAPIQCAVLSNPSHRNHMMRFALLLIASLSVGLLVAIALHYTRTPLVFARHMKLPPALHRRNFVS
jgi:hypothetical protein